jgi:DNA-binding response OmpR family regulator
MARVFLAGIEESVANRLKCVLEVEKHRIEHRSCDAPVDDFLDADIVFACANVKQYVPLLRTVRQARSAMPFIVVTEIPDTSAWLTALEAGATDYCSAPFELRDIHWLMESALPSVRTACA